MYYKILQDCIVLLACVGVMIFTLYIGCVSPQSPQCQPPVVDMDSTRIISSSVID